MMNSCHNYSMVLHLVHSVGNGSHFTRVAQNRQHYCKLLWSSSSSESPPSGLGTLFWCMRKNCPSQTAQSTASGLANSFREYSQTLLTFNFSSLSQWDLLCVAQYFPAENTARWARSPLLDFLVGEALRKSRVCNNRRPQPNHILVPWGWARRFGWVMWRRQGHYQTESRAPSGALWRLVFQLLAEATWKVEMLFLRLYTEEKEFKFRRRRLSLRITARKLMRWIDFISVNNTSVNTARCFP